MKKTLLLATFASLLALPVSAQQGPAGVPGAPGLAPAQPVPLAEPLVGKKSPSQVVPKKADREPPPAAPAGDCARDTEPARCILFQKTRRLCGDKLGDEHRRCLYDNLVPRK